MPQPATQPLRILGIDPGLRLTGYGVIDHRPLRPATLLDAGVIRLNTKAPIPQRLVELERELEEIINEHQPHAMAVELLYSNYKHPRTAILMAHARGVILLCAERRGLALHQIAANRVKQSLTGHGHMSKEGMQSAIQHYFNLAQPPSPPDVADALAIALAAGQDSIVQRRYDEFFLMPQYPIPQYPIPQYSISRCPIPQCAGPLVHLLT